MKTIFTIISVCFLNLITVAQELNGYPLNEIPAKYVEIEYRPKSLFTKSYCVVDYGQIAKYTSASDLKKFAAIKENDELKEFKSEIEMLNYLAKHGFKILETYQDIVTNTDHEVTAEKRKYLLENLNY